MINSKNNEGITLSSSVMAYEKLGAMITSKQADILIAYLEKHPNLELDFSDKHGYMIEHPFAVTPSIFSSWGLTDELDTKVSYKKKLCYSYNKELTLNYILI
jgi:hypothetical protein